MFIFFRADVALKIVDLSDNTINWQHDFQHWS